MPAVARRGGGGQVAAETMPSVSLPPKENALFKRILVSGGGRSGEPVQPPARPQECEGPLGSPPPATGPREGVFQFPAASRRDLFTPSDSRSARTPPALAQTLRGWRTGAPWVSMGSFLGRVGAPEPTLEDSGRSFFPSAPPLKNLKNRISLLMRSGQGIGGGS